MTIDTAKMSTRGQIIIPKSMRECIGATENTIFAFAKLDDDTLVMKKLDTSRLLADFKKIRKKAKKLGARDIQREINASRGN